MIDAWLADAAAELEAFGGRHDDGQDNQGLMDAREAVKRMSQRL